MPRRAKPRPNQPVNKTMKDSNDSDSAFWQFSLRFYERPGVPDLCLALQDRHGVDINLLFLLIFLAMHGRRVTADEIRQMDRAIEPWRVAVVHPLRALRRQLKNGVSPMATSESDELRNAIKRCELWAEQLQQMEMERQFATEMPAEAPNEVLDLAKVNINAYDIVISASRGALPCKLVQQLLEEFERLRAAGSERA